MQKVLNPSVHISGEAIVLKAPPIVFVVLHKIAKTRIVFIVLATGLRKCGALLSHTHERAKIRWTRKTSATGIVLIDYPIVTTHF